MNYVMPEISQKVREQELDKMIDDISESLSENISSIITEEKVINNDPMKTIDEINEERTIEYIGESIGESVLSIMNSKKEEKKAKIEVPHIEDIDAYVEKIKSQFVVPMFLQAVFR